MPLSFGTRLGPYEIVAPLGAGGMGEVYRATDTRLKRQVAIKILPSDLAADPSRHARFQREAEVLASLNHPHIAAIYGFEESGPSTGSGRAIHALVMELVEGPTLADRIAQGRIPIDEALPIARQIADALEAAHEQGIVHRDLKPANIKVRDDGTVKVLDFGLAKAREKPGEAPSGIDLTVNLEASPTMASPAPEGLPSLGEMSRAGMILGTAAYMSPEQARGRAVDKRTDVWAFGAVLYEMLTGVRAFQGDDVTELLASVVKSTPDWSLLPADVPPQVVTLIQRCLEKDRNARIGDIAVARFLLSGDATLAAFSAAVPASVASAPAPRRQTLLLIAAALVAAVVGALAAWLLARRTTDVSSPVTHLQMSVLPAEQLSVSLFGSERPARISLALSPDGRRAVFVGTRDRLSQLYDRPLDRAEAAPIAGTEGAIAPFFSPDGAWIAFVAADNKIKKVPVGGGAAATICDLPAAPFWGASWGEDGTVFLAARPGIFKVSSAGGSPAAVTTADLAKGNPHMLPQLLPGSKTLLYTAPPNIVALTLATNEQRTLFEGTDARYVSFGGSGATGHLVYMNRGTLMAVPFDARAVQVIGAPVALVEGVMHGVNAGNTNDETLVGQFAISNTGTLLYAAGGIVPNRQSQLVWVDLKGVAQPIPGASGRSFQNPHISPDRRKILLSIRRDASRDTDIWVYDIARGTLTKVTLDGGGSPVWSPDGKHILYSFASDLYMVNADGSGKPEAIAPGNRNRIPASWASATNTIAFLERPTPDTFAIYAMPMDGPSARKPVLFLESRFSLWHAAFSPDGRWIAYASAESGMPQVYVQPYPGPGERIQISTTFGSEPVWTANGRELLFRGGTPTMMPVFSAAIASSSPFRAGVPRVVFEADNGLYDRTAPISAWDATADGQRFLMVKIDESIKRPVTTMHVVLNWVDELKRRAPAQ